MSQKLLLVTLCSILFAFGCVSDQPEKGLPETTRINGVGSDVGVIDGALITHEIEEPKQAESDSVEEKEEMIIVQCPACSQRVDVTGLPRERIRCPNCNSLFTY